MSDTSAPSQNLDEIKKDGDWESWESENWEPPEVLPGSEEKSVIESWESENWEPPEVPLGVKDEPLDAHPPVSGVSKSVPAGQRARRRANRRRGKYADWNAQQIEDMNRAIEWSQLLSSQCEKSEEEEDDDDFMAGPAPAPTAEDVERTAAQAKNAAVIKEREMRDALAIVGKKAKRKKPSLRVDAGFNDACYDDDYY